MAEGKTRITVTLADGVLALLDEARKRSGLSRSAEITRIVQEVLEPRNDVTPEQMIAILQQYIRQRDGQ